MPPAVRRRRPTLHLLHGLPGAGKTRFARILEREIGAERFTHDAWMHRLFGARPPAERFHDYHVQVSAMIWDLAEKALRMNRDVILDFGFWTRRDRDEARAKAERLGARVRLYALVCDRATMLERLRERNRVEDPESLPVDEPTFHAFAAALEAPGADECPVQVETTTHGYRILQ